MPEYLELSTAAEQITLRELSLADARAFWDAVSSPESGYPGLSGLGDFQMAAETIDEPENPAILRMGIHKGDALVGTIDATPRRDEGTELAAWVHPAHRGNGYASAATKAIVEHLVATGEVERIYAETAPGDTTSQDILARSGFVQSAARAGKLIFDFAALTPEEPAAELGPMAVPAAGITSVEETRGFRRTGFTGHEYIRKNEGAGFSALLVDVNGEHPTKRILEGTVRTYFVANGEGAFMLDGKTQAVKPGDYITIPSGSTYSYAGRMQLLETNISPDNSFRDERVSEASKIPTKEKAAQSGTDHVQLQIHSDQRTALQRMADTYHWKMERSGIPVPKVPAPAELPANPDFYRG